MERSNEVAVNFELATYYSYLMRLRKAAADGASDETVLHLACCLIEAHANYKAALAENKYAEPTGEDDDTQEFFPEEK